MTITSSIDGAVGLLGAVAGSLPQVQSALTAEGKAVETFTSHNPELSGLVPAVEGVIENYVGKLGPGILSFVEELLPHVQTAATTATSPTPAA